MKSSIGVGLIGMGTVGSGVARIISESSLLLSNQVGLPLILNKVAVNDVHKQRSFMVPQNILGENPEELINDDSVQIIVELMGGEHPALEYILGAVKNGKHVVTANKEVISKHGSEIFSLARENNVRVLFEGSVGGGIPIISPLMRDLAANDIRSIKAIINGTTNYILTRMANEQADYQSVLSEAQKLGYAESDPASDVEGVDAGYKLSILSTLAFRASIKNTDIFTEGITNLTDKDFQYAKELGYSIKLLAIATRTESQVLGRVHPAFIPSDQMLAKVDDVLNAVEIETDLVDKVLFHGPGAGSMPTSSAVVADIVNIARTIAGETDLLDPVRLSEKVEIASIDTLSTKYYFRLEAADRPGVLARIATVLGDCGISISSFIQKGLGDQSTDAELVIMTHEANESSVTEAVSRLSKLDVVRMIGNVIRVVE
ncbi:homoserine dehydrogenase [Chloroflexi bacterium]|nr:homoserine dehydrogenase [Chloroflexota bacterium]